MARFVKFYLAKCFLTVQFICWEIALAVGLSLLCLRIMLLRMSSVSCLLCFSDVHYAFTIFHAKCSFYRLSYDNKVNEPSVTTLSYWYLLHYTKYIISGLKKSYVHMQEIWQGTRNTQKFPYILFIIMNSVKWVNIAMQRKSV